MAFFAERDLNLRHPMHLRHPVVHWLSFRQHLHTYRSLLQRLFYRALLKKESYIFEEPTNCIHPIVTTYIPHEVFTKYFPQCKIVQIVHKCGEYVVYIIILCGKCANSDSQPAITSCGSMHYVHCNSCAICTVESLAAMAHRHTFPTY